jgi:hypothetical protein
LLGDQQRHRALRDLLKVERVRQRAGHQFRAGYRRQADKLNARREAIRDRFSNRDSQPRLSRPTGASET